MSDPRLRQMKIKAGVVRRLTKEKITYEKEAVSQREKVGILKAENGDSYMIKKQEEVLQEALMMIPDTQRRLERAFEDLKNIIDSEKDLEESEDFQTAKQILEAAKLQMPDKLPLH